QNDTLQLPLSRLTGTVLVQRDPANTIVSWSRAGDSRWEVFDGNSKELPEGEYNFRAQADGYPETTLGPVGVVSGKSVTVPVRLSKARAAEAKSTTPPSVCSPWPDGQPDKGACKLMPQSRTTFQAYSQAIETGSIEMSAFSRDDKMKWQLGYRDE